MRFATYLITLFLAISLTFIFFHMIPANPIDRQLMLMEEQYGYGVPGARKIVEEYKRQFGLEGTLLDQYLHFLEQLIVYRNFGPSFINYPQPAQVLIMKALPWSIGLLTLCVLISWVIGNLLGALIGWRRDKKWSKYMFVAALCMSRVPFYFFAILLVYVFVYVLGIFPLGGAYSPNVSPESIIPFITSVIIHGTLPALSIILSHFAAWLISMRSLIVTILGEDYILFAEAKGLRRNRILMKYAMRNALLPQVTGLAMSLGSTVSGSYLVEYIFVYPGVGSLFIQAVNLMDFNTIQACIVTSIFAVLTMNLFIDIFYPFVDPRIKGG